MRYIQFVLLCFASLSHSHAVDRPIEAVGRCPMYSNCHETGTGIGIDLRGLV